MGFENTAPSPGTQACGTEAPTPVVIPVHAAPKKAPCPNCGKRGRRKGTFTRRVRTVAFKKIAYLEITGGEYGAQCGCRKTIRNAPEGVLPRALYDNKVRDLVLDRILLDGMSIERTLESLRREFLLELSTGFVHDVLHDRVRELDMAEHRREVLERFRGTLGVDELHLGRFTLLLATATCLWPSRWSTRTTRTTCGDSSGTSRTQRAAVEDKEVDRSRSTTPGKTQAVRGKRAQAAGKVRWC